MSGKARLTVLFIFNLLVIAFCIAMCAVGPKDQLEAWGGGIVGGAFLLLILAPIYLDD